VKRGLRCCAAAASLASSIAGSSANASAAPPPVSIVDEGVRLRRDLADDATPPGLVRLRALAGETVAFQVVIDAVDEPLSGVTVDLAGVPAHLGVERLVEHYVEIRQRSRNEQRPDESLGWSPAARPHDVTMLGWMPDALIPVEAAPPWCPYPLVMAKGQRGAVWVDVTVPDDAPAGAYLVKVAVGSSAGLLRTVDVELEVSSAKLPYRAASVFAYYDTAQLASRFPEARAVEPQLWQLLHRHHVDAFPAIDTVEDAERLAPALDGSLFTEAHGYRGPGAGLAPAAIAIGAYGGLGEPDAEKLARALSIARKIPAGVEDLLLYAIDEQCQSPLGPRWIELLRGAPEADRIQVAHTCHEDPRTQPVELVMMPAQTFDLPMAREARDAGRKVWAYNGAMPRTGTLMLDAPLVGLTVNGWIAASRGVGRWFYWETTFWNDGNRGGKGPIDPFTVAESFHNADGDACLGDGLLLYPGTQKPPFAARSVGLPAVLPSMRLKALRRGIADAGLYALARANAPDTADTIMSGVVPRALTEVAQTEGTPWQTDPMALARARDELRALIPPRTSLDAGAVARVLDGSAATRPGHAPPLPAPRGVVIAVVCAAALAGAALLALTRRRRA
jgi:hypothetical protein